MYEDYNLPLQLYLNTDVTQHNFTIKRGFVISYYIDKIMVFERYKSFCYICNNHFRNTFELRISIPYYYLQDEAICDFDLTKREKNLLQSWLDEIILKYG